MGCSVRLWPTLITIRPDGSFELHRRTFAHDDLKALAGQSVRVLYETTDSDSVVVVDMQYRRLCIATLRNENV